MLASEVNTDIFVLVSGQQAGVRYITEDLIRKIAKEDQIEMITNLNLTLAKEGGKKIKVGFHHV